VEVRQHTDAMRRSGLRYRGTPDAVLVWRAFETVAERIEAGKAALVGAVPTARVEGRPVAEALLEFEGELRAARERMDAWRRSENRRLWAACRDGLDDALRLAEGARLRAPSIDFESLVDLIGRLLEPLDPFAEAERLLKVRRRRFRRS
jgi:hypothetical protein